MPISVVRTLDGACLRVEVLADVEVGTVVERLLASPLVARPAEVLHVGVGGVGDPVYLLPLGPADVAEPNLFGARTDREAEGVAQPVGDDAPGVGAIAVVERVVG